MSKNHYKMIKNNSTPIYTSFPYIKWENVTNWILKNKVKGNLFAEANAASIWGRQSEMGLLRAMGSMNANIKYSLYD